MVDHDATPSDDQLLEPVNFFVVFNLGQVEHLNCITKVEKYLLIGTRPSTITCWVNNLRLMLVGSWN